MDNRGQAAMEYLMTYGWAILVIVIVGIVLWQMGLFSLGGKLTPGYSGFSIVVPIDWFVTSAGGSCSLSVVFVNGAGEDLREFSVVGGEACAPQNAPAGQRTVCTRAISGCGGPGSEYEEDMTVTYKRASDNQSFQTAGTLWGTVG